LLNNLEILEVTLAKLRLNVAKPKGHRVVFNGKVANIAVGVKEAVCVKLGHNLH
jgi:hypothetical protein